MNDELKATAKASALLMNTPGDPKLNVKNI
jgi:hypothetical protein